MKNDLKKKLAAYTSLGGAVMIMHSNAGAQILYFNPPDIIIDNNFYNLDLNNDGVYDFRFLDLELSSSEFIYFAGNDDSRQILTQSDCFFYDHFPKLIHEGQVIKNNVPGDWQAIEYGSSFGLFCTVNGSCSGNIWAGKKNKFFAFRFKDQAGQNNSNYGWMRVSVGANCQAMKINDWAYNSVPGGSIAAGQTLRLDGNNDADENGVLSNLSVFAYHDQLYIQNNEASAMLHITVINVNGQKLISVNSTDVETKIGLTDLSPGVYIIQMNTGTACISKKIVKD